MNKPNINGIDVSECEHHYTNPVNGTIYHGCAIYEQVNELGYSQDTLCEQNPNCYFKQLKRLQEENKKLVKANQDLAEVHRTIGQDLYNECVSLRSELTVQKEVAKAFCRGLEQTEKLLGKYKQALEEIREIANAIINGKHITNDIEGHLKELAKEIINICEEL